MGSLNELLSRLDDAEMDNSMLLSEVTELRRLIRLYSEDTATFWTAEQTRREWANQDWSDVGP